MMSRTSTAVLCLSVREMDSQLCCRLMGKVYSGFLPRDAKRLLAAHARNGF